MSQPAADPGAHADLVRLRRDKAEIKTLLRQVIGEHRLARGFALPTSMPGVGLKLLAALPEFGALDGAQDRQPGRRRADR